MGYDIVKISQLNGGKYLDSFGTHAQAVKRVADYNTGTPTPWERCVNDNTQEFCIIKTSADPVNSPSHYVLGGIEVIDAIEAWGLGFRLANVVKYVARAAHKGKQLEDLRKARWYLDREISKLEAK
jgi:hypothetical protein